MPDAALEAALAAIPGVQRGGAAEPPQKRARKGKEPPRATAGGAEVQEAVNVPAGRVGAVIGKAGLTVKSTEGVTGAAVQVAAAEPGAPTRQVLLRGSPPAVAAARAMVLALLAQADAAAPLSRAEERVPCAVDRIGWVVGPKGETVKALRALTGARLDVLEEVAENGVRRGVLCLAGSPAEVAEARAAVLGLIGAASVSASKAYAAQLVAAAEARRVWDDAAAKRAAPPPVAPSEAAAAPAGAVQVGQWRRVVTKHPDGSELAFWLHNESGLCRW